MEKQYVNWHLEKPLNGGKKRFFVKCFCEKCGKQMADRNILQMEKTTELKCKSCSLKEKSKQSLEKRKKTCLEKYGVDNPSKVEEIKQKIKNNNDYKSIGKKISQIMKLKSQEDKEKSNKKRKETISKIENFYENRQKKIEKTNIEKYGYSTILKDKEKMKKSIKEKYGNEIENISQTKLWKDKIKKISQEKYNVEWYTQNKEIINKIQKTNIEKYGYKYYINNPNFRKKLYKKWTSEALQRYELELMGLEFIDDTLVRCKKCGYEKNIKHTTEINLGFCPNCHNNLRSKFEFLVSEYLTHRGIKFQTNYRKLIPPKEIDIYIPEYKLGIEIDGLYYHQNKDKNYHLNKTLECEKQGIRLIHFTDIDLISNKEICLSMIDSAIGFTTKIYARKCQIKEIDNNLYKSFCNENHIQGYSTANIKLGLFYNNKLLQIASFSKLKFDNNYEYEFIRECSKLGFTIIGGKSKLFKYFIKNYNPESIISFCDKSKFTGKSYEKLGMKFLNFSNPSFIFYKNGKTLSQYQCKKHKLKSLLEKFDENLTELENMKLNGYGIVYDCGENTYIWQK